MGVFLTIFIRTAFHMFGKYLQNDLVKSNLVFPRTIVHWVNVGWIVHVDNINFVKENQYLLQLKIVFRFCFWQ